MRLYDFLRDKNMNPYEILKLIREHEDFRQLNLDTLVNITQHYQLRIPYFNDNVVFYEEKEYEKYWILAHKKGFKAWLWRIWFSWFEKTHLLKKVLIFMNIKEKNQRL